MTAKRAALLSGALFLLLTAVYASVLPRSLSLDEVDIEGISVLPGPRRFELCAREFVRSHRFRPAMLPYCELMRVTKARPALMRLTLLLALAASSAALAWLALVLGFDAATAALAGALYALGWSHWESVIHSLNLGQLLGNGLVFAGLALLARSDRPRDLLLGFGAGALAALLKEDGVVFGPLAFLLILVVKKRAPRARELAAFAAAVLGYAALRRAFVDDFLAVGTGEHALALLHGLDPRVYLRGLSLAAAPLTGGASWTDLRAGLGACAALAAVLGAGLGFLLPLPRAAKTPARGAAYLLVLATVGLWPFVFFDDGLMAHRSGKAAAAVAVVAAALAARALSRLSPRAARAALCALLALAAGAAAAAFRFPSPESPVFVLEAPAHDSDHADAALEALADARAGDVVAFAGFGSLRTGRRYFARAPNGVLVHEGEPEVLMPAAEGGRVWLLRFRGLDVKTLTVERWPDGFSKTYSWTAGRCAPACRR